MIDNPIIDNPPADEDDVIDNPDRIGDSTTEQPANEEVDGNDTIENNPADITEGLTEDLAEEELMYNKDQSKSGGAMTFYLFALFGIVMVRRRSAKLC